MLPGESGCSSAFFQSTPPAGALRATTRTVNVAASHVQSASGHLREDERRYLPRLSAVN